MEMTITSVAPPTSLWSPNQLRRCISIWKTHDCSSLFNAGKSNDIPECKGHLMHLGCIRHLKEATQIHECPCGNTAGTLRCVKVGCLLIEKPVPSTTELTAQRQEKKNLPLLSNAPTYDLEISKLVLNPDPADGLIPDPVRSMGMKCAFRLKIFDHWEKKERSEAKSRGNHWKCLMEGCNYTNHQKVKVQNHLMMDKFEKQFEDSDAQSGSLEAVVSSTTTTVADQTGLALNLELTDGETKSAAGTSCLSACDRDMDPDVKDENDANQAGQAVENCLRNHVILRTIFHHISNHELVNLSVVNKLWNYEARSVMRKRGNLMAFLRSTPYLPFQPDLAAFGADLRQMNLVPFSGISIKIHSWSNALRIVLSYVYESMFFNKVFSEHLLYKFGCEVVLNMLPFSVTTTFPLRMLRMKRNSGGRQ